MVNLTLKLFLFQPQKHEVQVKRRGSLVSKSFADEAYEQYNGNMKGKLGKNEDGYANVAY